MNTRIFIVDDHPLLCSGLRQAISQRPDFEVVGQASTGASALESVTQLSPDLIVIDVHLPDINGLDLISRLLQVLPSAKVIVFSGDATRSLIDQALHAGACGYVWKQTSADELIRAIGIVATGKLYLSPEISGGILEDYRTRLSHDAEPEKPFLSERDKMLLRLVTEGRRNKEIAEELEVSTKAVEAYRSRLMKKLGCSSPAELVRFAIREGIVAA